MTEQRAALHLDVTWLGRLSTMFAGREVIYLGTDDAALRSAVVRAKLVSVDPGDPCGVAVWPADDGYPITLHEGDPAVLASTLLDMVSSAGVGDLAVVCETPLHGAVRVFDPAPWKLRGFLELLVGSLSRYGTLFVPAQVANLKAGGNLAKVNTPKVSPHAKDALAYGAVAITLNNALRKRMED